MYACVKVCLQQLACIGVRCFVFPRDSEEITFIIKGGCARRSVSELNLHAICKF